MLKTRNEQEAKVAQLTRYRPDLSRRWQLGIFSKPCSGKFGSASGEMNHQAFGPVDTEDVAINIASFGLSINIGDNALDGDGLVMVMTLVFLVLGAVSVGIWVSLRWCGHRFDNVANDTITMPQSPPEDGNKWDQVLEAKHKIFLSHSGAQKSFVADVCADLMGRDRYLFFDRLRSSLPIGDKFPTLIFGTIKQCKVGVVVLSEEFFTRSKWPMLELVAMVEESNKLIGRIQIIPVFYSISRDRCCDPIVQAKWMKKYWKKWQKKDRRIDLGKWKSALGVFGSTTGLIMKDGMLDGELRAEIVKAVCKKVLLETRWDDSGVKGKTRLCQEIRKKVYKGLGPKDLKGEVQVFGMYGMGGIGKTTACKILCNDLFTDYDDKVCHIELGKPNEMELLWEVLKRFSRMNDEVLNNISDVGVGYDYLKRHIVKERVFLALDNVSDESKEQAKSYLEVNFGGGSVVLVTARSRDQLPCLGIRKYNCFAMLELELEEAKCLFLSYTQLKENEVDQELLEKCLKRCYFSNGLSSTSSSDGKHYHPLALKVLGSEVGDFIRLDMTRQATMLRRIDTFNLSRKKEHPVFSILRSSFDSLNEEDQLLFLLIAVVLPESCGFPDPVSIMEWLGMVTGKETNEIEWMLECLKRRSLLESFNMSYDIFRMHDLWREFAADEVEGGQGKARHLLYKNEKYSDRVDLTEFPTMKVVKLKAERTKDLALDVGGLKHLKSLEVIGHRRDAVVKVNGLGTLENLTYLSWLSAASNSCIAELGRLTNLQVVDLWGFRGDRLPNMSKWTNLRVLDLSCSYSLQSINLRNLTNLTHLILLACTSLESVELGDFGGDKLSNMGNLTNLEFLDLKDCESLQSIHLRNLTNLTHLCLCGCTGLESVELGDFRGDKLPKIGKLTSLRFLNLGRCDSLRSVNLRNLTNLAQLDLGGCTHLRSLDITGCSSMADVEGLRDVLVSLEELRATKCESLARLPYVIRPPKLRVLEIEPKKVYVRDWKLVRRFKKH